MAMMIVPWMLWIKAPELSPTVCPEPYLRNRLRRFRKASPIGHLPKLYYHLWELFHHKTQGLKRGIVFL